MYEIVRGLQAFFVAILYIFTNYHNNCLFSNKELHNQWQELVEKLDDEVIIPLTAYQSQFPDIKVFTLHGSEKILIQMLIELLLNDSFILYFYQSLNCSYAVLIDLYTVLVFILYSYCDP